MSKMMMDVANLATSVGEVSASTGLVTCCLGPLAYLGSLVIRFGWIRVGPMSGRS